MEQAGKVLEQFYKSDALLALTGIDLANNELRTLPAELFTLVSLRYLNAAQNKLERLPRSGDPPDEEPKGRTRKKRAKLDVYSAPALQDLYLQDNRLEELPPELFRLPALTTLDVSNNKLRALPPAVWTAPALRDLSAALNHLRALPAGDENTSECSSPTALSPSEASPQPPAEPEAAERSADQSKNSSRSPSIERSDSEAPDDDAPVVVAGRGGHAVWSEARRPHAWRGELDPLESPAPAAAGSRLTSLNLAHNQFTCVPPPLACRAPRLTRLNMAYNSLRRTVPWQESPASLNLAHNQFTCVPPPLACRAPRLTWLNMAYNSLSKSHYSKDLNPVATATTQESPASLNLAHNQFTCVPPPLACRAPRLTRLNMAYNSLRSMSYVTSYPTSLRQLDLSHNEITCWPSLPQIENFGSTEGDPLACYCAHPPARARARSGGSVRAQLLHAACPARRHLRLEGLRTLVSPDPPQAPRRPRH
ncbi:leucine-rich repeat serine/threonine-protein kinase 1-like [Ostrinia furnacalis]|uniref:leucine-rich repeat serine/threonine-protein kinase 1-like n=1 Tax=Ostrinia furnacalis TaxID=93504 RepID=UPI0010398BE9|nr:leucine-rich repeat serine/threonine-protein kinase 1-like [Ostrinia furnacalis]